MPSMGNLNHYDPRVNPAMRTRAQQEEAQRFHDQHGGKFSWGGAAKGGIAGAGAGFMIGGPVGAVVGGAAGGFLGGRAGAEQEQADATRRAGLDQAIAGQDTLRREMEARRQQDLERTMAFYGPALQALERLYGIPMSAWGEGLPQNARAAMAPPRQGMLNGQAVNIANPRPEFSNMLRPLGGAPTPVPGVQKMATLRPNAPFRRGF